MPRCLTNCGTADQSYVSETSVSDGPSASRS
jgi:hypothetical protein